MKKIIRGINTLIILVAAAATMYGQINLSGKKIHELPALPSNVVDTNYLFIIANPIDGKPYKFKKSTLLSGATGVVDGNYGDVTVSGVTWSINASSVQNSKMAAMANNTFKGNLSGSTAVPQDLTVGQMQSSLGINTKLNATDTASLSNRINSKMTAADTAYLSNRINNKQDLDADLTSISGASGTNTIYYRSAANTWSPVTIGGNMTFSGGTLNSTASGGGTWGSITGTIGNQTDLAYELSQKQAQLVSASNIKTINNISILGSGNISVGGGGSQTLDQTLEVANTTDTSIVQNINGITREINPTNFNTSYGTAGYAKGFTEGVETFAGVNSPDSRPNVVYSFGYNVNPSGARINTNEASFRFGYETNYNINSDTLRRGFEFHLPELITKEGNTIRLWSMYVNKSGGFTELNSQIENLYFTKVSNGANWLTMTNSSSNNVIHQYGNDSASIIYTAMTNPDSQAGRVVTKYYPTGSDTYEYTIAADNPTGKLFTTNMPARFDNSVLSTSFMNINNTSSTGLPSQPTLRLDHANSGTSKVQDWYYNATLIAEVDKDYSLMTYKPVLFYYGGLMYGDLTLNYSFGGVLKLVSLPVYADEAAATTGGLATNTVYKTSTGELRIKL